MGNSGTTEDYGKSFKVGDPVSAANGAYLLETDLLDLGGPMNLNAVLSYRSDYELLVEPLPFNFHSNLFSSAEVFPVDENLSATFYLTNGDQVSFIKDGNGEWKPTDPTLLIDDLVFYRDNISQIRYVFKEKGDFFYLVDPVNELVYIYYIYISFGEGKTARLRSILDRNGNAITYEYNPPDAFPTRVSDGLGRSFDLTYTDFPTSLGGTNRYLTAIRDQANREVKLNYEENAQDNNNRTALRSITDASGKATSFQYSGSVHQIAGRTLPEGNTPQTQAYGWFAFYDTFPFYTYSRVESQTDVYGNMTTFSYDNVSNVMTVHYPDNTTEAYEHYSRHGLPKEIWDATGKSMQFGRDDAEHITEVTDRMGDSSSFTYHTESGKIASVTNADNKTITYTYTPQNQMFTNPDNDSEQVEFTFYNLTRTDYPDGTREEFTYDAKGNVTERTDRRGKKWNYAYNGRGQVTEITNPAGGKSTFTYNDDGTLASGKDSDTEPTTYGYDDYKRVTRITHPDGKFIQIAYDLNDRVTSITDENNHTYAYRYDGNGNLTEVTDPAGNKVQYAHDLMDRVEKITDRLGKSSVLTYDGMGRLASAADPNGIQTQWGYDLRGRLDAMTLGGQTWRIGSDDEGVPSSFTTPLNHTTQFETDKLGYITRITNPLGQSASWTRDAMNRIGTFTDPLLRETSYDYDGSDSLTGVTLPGGGAAAYTRNDLGLLGQITDLNGNNWNFGYTAMGRLQSESDPLGNTRQYDYNTRGQLSQITYPTGESWAGTYDDAGNLTHMIYSGGPALEFTYNALDQLLTANGVSLTRDAEGRVTDTQNPGASFGATYDDGGRIRTLTYNNNAFTVTYSYDNVTGLLKRVEDDLTKVWMEFTYDHDRNLTGITRSNGVSTTLTRDDAGRLTRIQDGSFLDLQYTPDASGQVTQTDSTAPLDPADLLAPSTQNFIYDAAHRLNTAGYAYDARGRQTTSPDHAYNWDGASRLVTVDNVTLGYNGLGDVATRTEGGATVHYYYNYALPLSPIVAERDDTAGKFLRYYVYSPAGSLLYMIDAADGNKVYFYHFDRTGSTLALTDSAGEVTDSYAYSPYGKLLRHEGGNPQSFTFVGQWGVRQEGAGGTLYQMGARYYDADTARFISREPLWPNLASPLQINPYQYAYLDPVNYIDPLGEDPERTENFGPNFGLDVGLAIFFKMFTLPLLHDAEFERQQRKEKEIVEHKRQEYETWRDSWFGKFTGNRHSVEKAGEVLRKLKKTGGLLIEHESGKIVFIPRGRSLEARSTKFEKVGKNTYILYEYLEYHDPVAGKRRLGSVRDYFDIEAE